MVKIEQVRLLYDQATSGLVVTLVATLILGTFLLTEETSVPTIGAWWLATVLVVAWRWWLIQQFCSAKDVDSNPTLWTQRFVVGASLAGLTWGIGGAASASDVTLLNQVLILAVIATMVSTAILFLGSVVTVFLWYMLGAALPLLIWMLWQRDFIHLVMAALTCVFIAGTWAAVLKYSRILEQTLYLQLKSNSLTEELRTSNEQLKHSDSMLRDAARKAMLGHWHFDEVASEYLSISDEYARIFGYTVDEFLESYRTLEQDMKLVLPADRTKVLEGYELEEGVEMDYRIVRKDGNIRYVREISEHLLDEAGKLVEARGTLQDITDIKEAQHEAEAATLAKSEFLSRMSHELRTPMSAVLGFGQLLEIDATLNEKQQKHLGHILSAANHLLALINEVLELDHVDSGRIQLTMEAVDPGETLQECASMVQSLAEKHNVTMENQMTPNNVPGVWADKIRFKQVLLNLISNGIKYNREGGRVTVSCEDTGEGMLRISVIDTGIGIPEEHMGELFEPFSRLGAEKSDIEGTGIGLTITKHLVKLMGGELGVETTQDEGSTFWVEFGLDRYMGRD